MDRWALLLGDPDAVRVVLPNLPLGTTASRPCARGRLRPARVGRRKSSVGSVAAVCGSRHQAAGGYLQTTAVRPESEGVTVSAGIAPSLSATRWERTLSGVIRDTSRSSGRRSCAQSRIAEAASVAYPRPQCSRIKAQPSSSCAWLPAFARVDGVQSRASKIMRPAWPTTRPFAEAVSRTKGPSPPVLHPAMPSSVMTSASSSDETGSLPKACMIPRSVKRSYKASASAEVGIRRQSLSV